MDVFGGLRKLLGIDTPKPAQRQAPRQQPQQNIRYEDGSGVQNGQPYRAGDSPDDFRPVRPVTPGYESAARNYEDAYARGDYNSPYIIGQDPKNFGYGPDPGVRPRAVREPLYTVPRGATLQDILKRNQF